MVSSLSIDIEAHSSSLNAEGMREQSRVYTRYRQQVQWCKNPHCRRCPQGQGHRYWYRYTTQGNHTEKTYIGVHLPSTVDRKLVEEPVDTSHEQPLPEQVNDGSPLSQEMAHVRLYTFEHVRLERRQGFHLEADWNLVPLNKWQNDDAHMLLAYLLNGQAMYGTAQRSGPRTQLRETIAAVLWPGITHKKQMDRLDQTVAKVRSVLDLGQSRGRLSLLTIEHLSLTLANQQTFWYDADAFEYLARLAASRPLHEQEPLLREALSLYSEPWFPGVHETRWLTNRRMSLHRLAITCLLQLADLQIQRSYLHGAIELLQRGMHLEPTSEAIVDRLLRLLIQEQHTTEAIQVYRTFVEALKRDENRLSPPLHLQTLYQSIRHR